MKHSSFWYLTTLVLAIPTLPILVTKGMFMDGMHYAAIARNLAEGGEVWRPMAGVYSGGVLPLMPIFEAGFFWVLGDHFWVEKLFSGVMMALNAIAMVWVWRLLWGKLYNDTRKMAWWSVLVWGLFPDVGWSFGQNMLETQVSLFCLLSTGFVLNAMKNGRVPVNGVLAGLACLGAILTKGPVGLFPVMIPITYTITLDSRATSQAIVTTLYMVLVLAIATFILASYDPAVTFFKGYFQDQIFRSLSSTSDGGGQTMSKGRFLFRILAEIWLPFALTVLVAVIAFFKSGKKMAPWFELHHLRFSAFLMFLALGSSIPLMVSHKLRLFYIIPSEAFFALAFAAMSTAPLLYLLRLLTPKVSSYIKALTIAAWLGLAGVCVYLAGKTIRGAEMLENMERIAQFAYNRQLNYAPGLEHDLSITTYLNRHVKVNLVKEPAEFWVGRDWDSPPQGYEKLDLPLKGLILAQKQPVE